MERNCWKHYETTESVSLDLKRFRKKSFEVKGQKKLLTEISIKYTISGQSDQYDFSCHIEIRLDNQPGNGYHRIKSQQFGVSVDFVDNDFGKTYGCIIGDGSVDRQ